MTLQNYISNSNHPLLLNFLNCMIDFILFSTIPFISWFLVTIVSSIYTTDVNIYDENNPYNEKVNIFIKKIFNVFILIITLLYYYYIFFVLNYFNLYFHSIIGIIIFTIFILISPLYFIYLLFMNNDKEALNNIIINFHTFLNELKTLLIIKFHIKFTQFDKELFIFALKLSALILFATKIINITSFIFKSFFSKNIAKILAYIFFFFITYIYFKHNQKEINILYSISKDIIKTFISGKMQ